MTYDSKHNKPFLNNLGGGVAYHHKYLIPPPPSSPHITILKLRLIEFSYLQSVPYNIRLSPIFNTIITP